MNVDVIVFGSWAKLLPPGSEGGKITVEVPEGAVVGEVLDVLAMPKEARSFLTVNGSRVTEDTAIADGDEIRVIVPLGGG